MSSPNKKTLSNIGDKLTVLRQHTHNLGYIREGNSSLYEDGPSEASLLKAIEEVTAEIKVLIASDIALSADYSISALPDQLKNMCSVARNSWEMDDILHRDELIFKAMPGDTKVIVDLLHGDVQLFFKWLHSMIDQNPPIPKK